MCLTLAQSYLSISQTEFFFFIHLFSRNDEFGMTFQTHVISTLVLLLSLLYAFVADDLLAHCKIFSLIIIIIMVIIRI